MDNPEKTEEDSDFLGAFDDAPTQIPEVDADAPTICPEMVSFEDAPTICPGMLGTDPRTVFDERPTGETVVPSEEDMRNLLRVAAPLKVLPTATPRLQGETLKEVLARNPQGLGLDEAVHLALEIGRQLRDGVHGNLSPQTVFLCRDETVVLTDFGRSTDLSVYSAPDFLRKGFVGDACSDVFSLGVVFHEMLTGRLPYRDPSVQSYRDCWADPSAICIRVGWRNLFTGVKGVLRRALAFDRDRRYLTMDDFLDGLRRIRRRRAW